MGVQTQNRIISKSQLKECNRPTAAEPEPESQHLSGAWPHENFIWASPSDSRKMQAKPFLGTLE